jgi:hypothetical protein
LLADNAVAGKVKWCGDVSHSMGDTKRGRERKGQKKREQLREREVERTLEATDDAADPPEFPDDEEIDLGEESPS